MCVRESLCVCEGECIYVWRREERGKSCNEGQNIRERECVLTENVGHLLK